MIALTIIFVKHESRIFFGIREVDGGPQNCEVAARSPPLAAGRTDARNGPARVDFIDRSERELHSGQ
jgi:hypothetical protein